MHEDLLNLSPDDSLELYKIFLNELSDYLILKDDIYFVDDDIFIYNYTNCFILFLSYLLENKFKFL